MSYIGRGVDAISNVEKLDNITFSGTTTYALTKSSAAFTPVGANNILISIDGVIQQGNFSVSTTNIVFDWSPTSANTCNWIMHFGTGVLNVPADGSIVAAKMAANSVDSDAYVDASIDNAHLADDAVGVAELSATGTASSSTFLRGDNSWTAVSGFDVSTITGATALAVSPATTDELVLSDAGTLKRLDFTHIYPHPAFNVVADNTLSVATVTWTKLVLDSEILDSNGAYDAASNYRFTVPANEGGNYFFHCSVDIQEATDHDDVRLSMYKNGATHMLTQLGRFHNYDTASLTTMLSLAATDYVEMYIYHAKGSNMTLNVGDSSNRATRWCGFKLLGT